MQLGAKIVQMIDEFPLYVMRIQYDYKFDIFRQVGASSFEELTQFLYTHLLDTPTQLQRLGPDGNVGCSVFTARNAMRQCIMGRNLDYPHSRWGALVVFTEPKGAYRSISIVELSYLSKLPANQRDYGMLVAPYTLTEGMNERGVTIAMSAVRGGVGGSSSEKLTMPVACLLRLVLDYASNVDEAAALIQNYNAAMVPGSFHLHIGDVEGASAVVEFIGGKVVIMPSAQPWQISTNFMLATSDIVGGGHDRYDIIEKILAEEQGVLSSVLPMEALYRVWQTSTDGKSAETLWSAVYNMHTGVVDLVLGRNHCKTFSFNLPMSHGR